MGRARHWRGHFVGNDERLWVADHRGDARKQSVCDHAPIVVSGHLALDSLDEFGTIVAPAHVPTKRVASGNCSSLRAIAALESRSNLALRFPLQSPRTRKSPLGDSLSP